MKISRIKDNFLTITLNGKTVGSIEKLTFNYYLTLYFSDKIRAWWNIEEREEMFLEIKDQVHLYIELMQKFLKTDGVVIYDERNK